jgi:hypothetical protein
MSMMCPFCLQENAADALVCAACSRDIAVPASLLAERDDLARKRDSVRQQLIEGRAALEALKRRRKNRSP